MAGVKLPGPLRVAVVHENFLADADGHRHDQDVVTRDGLNQRAGHLFVAYQMGESVDAGLDEVRGISSVVDVRDDRQVARVGLIDNRAV